MNILDYRFILRDWYVLTVSAATLYRAQKISYGSIVLCRLSRQCLDAVDNALKVVLRLSCDLHGRGWIFVLVGPLQFERVEIEHHVQTIGIL